MFKKKLIVKFESALEEYPDILVPSKSMIPEWYKNISRWKDGEMLDSQNNLQSSIKHCMPFFDAISSGYMLLLPYDIHVKNNNGLPYITWRQEITTPPSWRSVSSNSVVPAGCYPTEYVWNTNMSFEVPKGYSAMLTHPLNRHDLPFVTLTGIIDGEYTTSPGSYPFFIKFGFEGIIEQGTPIAQLIPFKQESWVSQKTEGLFQEGSINGKKSRLVFSGWYKKTYWTRKDYS